MAALVVAGFMHGKRSTAKETLSERHSVAAAIRRAAQTVAHRALLGRMPLPYEVDHVRVGVACSHSALERRKLHAVVGRRRKRGGLGGLGPLRPPPVFRPQHHRPSRLVVEPAPPTLWDPRVETAVLICGLMLWGAKKKAWLFGNNGSAAQLNP